MGDIVIDSINNDKLDFSPQHICIVVDCTREVKSKLDERVTCLYHLSPKSKAIYQEYIDERENDRKVKEKEVVQLVNDVMTRTGKSRQEVRAFLELG